MCEKPRRVWGPLDLIVVHRYSITHTLATTCAMRQMEVGRFLTPRFCERIILNSIYQVPAPEVWSKAVPLAHLGTTDREGLHAQ